MFRTTKTIAELAGLEPAISAVTVLRDNHLHYNSKKAPITRQSKAVLFRCEAACLYPQSVDQAVY